jgi:tRNA pseudouridine55 synthase
MNTTKVYRARVMLGVNTDTYDAEGEVTSQRDSSHITPSQVETTLNAFRGHIEQVPPMYSAIKQGGQKLYDLARAGHTVDRPARPVHIETLTLSDWSEDDPAHPSFDLTVKCSAGTYIRSLAYDIGEALGVGGHLTALRRLASGAFTDADALPLDRLVGNADWYAWITAPENALREWPRIQLDAASMDNIIHGRTIPIADALQNDRQDMAIALGPVGEFVAVVEARDSQWRPHKVFLQR